MKNFHLHIPTEVVFGKDTENETGKYAKKYGKRALLVFGKESVIKSGLLSRVKKSLDESGVAYVEFSGAMPNPTLSHAEVGVKKSSGIQC